ncbi:hypothetical protein L596_024166 [Steinernema carpocapsae]|uniref:Uncharacterized protein n=1 Tax=Steinernema carpocapsae TaxID=34508 RepID=A0A4U5MFZ5_STECR|nr:hypothetical protein L596_024166 [Steinernema carpocapsae]
MLKLPPPESVLFSASSHLYGFTRTLLSRILLFVLPNTFNVVSSLQTSSQIQMSSIVRVRPLLDLAFPQPCDIPPEVLVPLGCSVPSSDAFFPVGDFRSRSRSEVPQPTVSAGYSNRASGGVLVMFPPNNSSASSSTNSSTAALHNNNYVVPPGKCHRRHASVCCDARLSARAFRPFSASSSLIRPPNAAATENEFAAKTIPRGSERGFLVFGRPPFQALNLHRMAASFDDGESRNSRPRSFSLANRLGLKKAAISNSRASDSKSARTGGACPADHPLYVDTQLANNNQTNFDKKRSPVAHMVDFVKGRSRTNSMMCSGAADCPRADRRKRADLRGPVSPVCRLEVGTRIFDSRLRRSIYAWRSMIMPCWNRRASSRLTNSLSSTSPLCFTVDGAPMANNSPIRSPAIRPRTATTGSRYTRSVVLQGMHSQRSLDESGSPVALGHTALLVREEPGVFGLARPSLDSTSAQRLIDSIWKTFLCLRALERSVDRWIQLLLRSDAQNT